MEEQSDDQTARASDAMVQFFSQVAFVLMLCGVFLTKLTLQVFHELISWVLSYLTQNLSQTDLQAANKYKLYDINNLYNNQTNDILDNILIFCTDWGTKYVP